MKRAEERERRDNDCAQKRRRRKKGEHDEGTMRQREAPPMTPKNGSFRVS